MGGSLAKLLPSSSGTPQITPDQAAQLTPEQVQQIAAHAEQHNPTVIDKMGGFYAQHPCLVQDDRWRGAHHRARQDRQQYAELSQQAGTGFFSDYRRAILCGTISAANVSRTHRTQRLGELQMSEEMPDFSNVQSGSSSTASTYLRTQGRRQPVQNCQSTLWQCERLEPHLRGEPGRFERSETRSIPDRNSQSPRSDRRTE